MATILGVINPQRVCALRVTVHTNSLSACFFPPIIAGQFLHSKVKIDEEQGLLFLPWRSAVPIKQRIVFKFARSEDPKEYKDTTCWTPVHRSSRGVGFIEGVYTDYEVESVLSTGFQFEAANSQGNI